MRRQSVLVQNQRPQVVAHFEAENLLRTARQPTVIQLIKATGGKILNTPNNNRPNFKTPTYEIDFLYCTTTTRSRLEIIFTSLFVVSYSVLELDTYM